MTFGHHGITPEAYRKVTTEIFTITRAITRGAAWIGSLEPVSPLRALDKLTWSLDGGSTSAAAEVRDPWQVIRRLGIRSPAGTVSVRSREPSPS